MAVKRKGLSIVMKVSILAGSIAAFASLIVGALIINGSTEIIYQEALNHLKYETNIKSLKLVSGIKNLSDDTKYLASTPPIQGIPLAIKSNDADSRDNSRIQVWQKRLTTIFTELIRAKPNYLQIRYIGIADGGKELTRVDRKGNLIQILPDKLLQKKGDTDYFKNAVKMSPGEVYISNISLNREHGEISYPHTPVMRAATPIFFKGELFGILVINMDFTNIFNDIVTNTPRELIPYVTNEEGYFLAHPDKNMTYGFDFGNENKINKIYSNLSLKSTDIRDRDLTVLSNNDVIHVAKAYYDPTMKERFFAVMLATSNTNLQKKSDNLKINSVVIMGILVVISLMIAAILASRLLRPLQSISVAVEDIANGREVTGLPVNSADEIGELARSFDNMRSQLQEKEQELIVSQGQVHYANKMASLGEMASGMAHEINSPIQTINLVAQHIQRQLKKKNVPENLYESMSKITESVSKVSAIIDGLKKVSRSPANDKFEKIKLSELVHDVLSLTEERFRLNNVQFYVNYLNVSPDTLVQCYCIQITQVLINLINNAYDAVQEVDVKKINMSIEEKDNKILFAISDSGPGISDDCIDKIFEPMFTTKDVGKGTGLGLAISREIILKHNGDIYIDHNSDKTRFVIELPVSQT